MERKKWFCGVQFNLVLNWGMKTEFEQIFAGGFIVQMRHFNFCFLHYF